jgi:hypothetical protein
MPTRVLFIGVALLLLSCNSSKLKLKEKELELKEQELKLREQVLDELRKKNFQNTIRTNQTLRIKLRISHSSMHMLLLKLKNQN